MTLGTWFWKSFEYMKEPIYRTKAKNEREEKICDECYDTGFEKGREFQKKENEQYLVEKR